MTVDKTFSRNDVTVVEEKTAYKGFFKIKRFLLKHRLFDGGESKQISRELFVRGHSVGVLLYDPATDRVGLVRQFRIGCLDNEQGPWIWEVIAGINDKQESPTQVAVREVKEESGLVISAESLVPICNYYSSPGGTDERLHLFCAIMPLPEVESVFGVADEAEDILFKTMAYPQAFSAMLQGTINNAATIIALQWLELNRQKLQTLLP
jgi:ADP-ribose pyrophosphatase